MTQKKQNNFILYIFIAFSYIILGAVSNVVGAILPKIRDTYEVSALMSAVLGAAFFIAYGLTSIPWGILIEKLKKKYTLLLASAITIVGVVVFAAIPGFIPSTLAMFLCGIGMTGFQVVMNPLVNDVSKPEVYSRNLTIFMVLFGVGSYIAPQIMTILEKSGFEWSTTYWVFAGFTVIQLIGMALQKFPKARSEQTEEKKHDESLIGDDEAFVHVEIEPKQKNMAVALMKRHPVVFLYALAIFLYVGIEVGIANTIGFYLEDKFNISTLLGEAAEAAKNITVSNYWAGLLIGRLVSTLFLHKMSNRLAIQIYGLAAILAISIVLFANPIVDLLNLPITPLNLVLIAFPAVSFAISIMFPTIFSLTTMSFDDKYSDAISSILCTAIIGGAVIAPAIAFIAESNLLTSGMPNWTLGLSLAYICFSYFIFLGFIRVNNKHKSNG